MYFEQIRSGGCLSYFVGCLETRRALVVDPNLERAEVYRSVASREGMRICYLVDTHTHADHFSALRELGAQLEAPRVMFKDSAAPFIDLRVEDGDSLVVGALRFRVIHTPGHTSDSVCLHVRDRVFTGDTLLIGGTGRTDLPTGDPEALYDSLFGRLLALPDETLVFPAHDYKGRESSTIGAERASNNRLQKTERAEFVAQMRALDLGMPTHLTEALRTNRTGGKTVAQLIGEAAGAVPFMGLDEVARRLGDPELVLLDVRERHAFAAAHLPGALHVPRGQLELRVNDVFPDPTVRVLTYCDYGKISTLAAATLRELGFVRAVAMDGGLQAWRAAGHPVDTADIVEG